MKNRRKIMAHDLLFEAKIAENSSWALAGVYTDIEADHHRAGHLLFNTNQLNPSLP
ncbi:MAG TPA: hypothetical protein VKZ51_04845 [Cyclobacteriaceae bacterium]|nr:hypothetical protein [Cyclobacteriaceae bacterium]